MNHDNHDQHTAPDPDTRDLPLDDRNDVRKPTQEQSADTKHGPSMIAYAVKDRGPDQDAVWRAVGAAFTHKDRKGLDLVLDAVPTDGRVTLRMQRKEAFKEQRRDGQTREGQSQNKDRGRDRSFER